MLHNMQQGEQAHPSLSAWKGSERRSSRPDGLQVKMERVWQRMVGAQSEQDEREASRIHGWNRKKNVFFAKSHQLRSVMPFPQRQKTYIRVCVFTQGLQR